MEHHGWIWIKIGIATASVITFAYASFMPRKEVEESIYKRLDRIESKLDAIIIGK